MRYACRNFEIWDLNFGVWKKFGLWLLGFGIFFLAACAAPTPTPPTLPDTSGPTSIQALLATGDLLPGAPRLPLVLYDGPQPVNDALAVQVTVFDLTDPDAPQIGWSGPATSYTDYPTPYWVVYPDLPRAGLWGLGLDMTRADGQVAQTQLTVQVLDDITSPKVGETPPASHNRTLATEPDIHQLTSGLEPVPALYQMTVAEALTSGWPSLIVFATPGFCTSKLCAPVVQSVEQVQAVQPTGVNYLHLEIYQSFNPLVPAGEPEEWHLTSEPWIFILDKTGRVAARLGGPVSPQELIEQLSPLLAP